MSKCSLQIDSHASIQIMGFIVVFSQRVSLDWFSYTPSHSALLLPSAPIWMVFLHSSHFCFDVPCNPLPCPLSPT